MFLTTKNKNSSSSGSRKYKKHKVNTSDSDSDIKLMGVTPIRQDNNSDYNSSSSINYDKKSCKSLLFKLPKSDKQIIETNIHDFLNSRKLLFKLDNKLEETHIDCITIDDSNLIINKTIVSDKVFIIKEYLSSGEFGNIFISNENGNKYIIKFMHENEHNIHEITIMNNIKDLIKDTNYIPNYVLIAYNRLNCNKINTQSNENNIYTTIKTCMDDSNYSMIIIEYFDGVLKDILTSILSISNKKEIYNSIFAQIFLTLYILHNKFNIIHNDTHYHNFFYKKITANNNEYFHYRINGIDYYIQNCGYLIVLGDYGLSKKVDFYETDVSYDILIKIKKFNDYKLIIFKIASLYNHSKYNDYLSRMKNIASLNIDNYRKYGEKYCDYCELLNEIKPENAELEFLKIMMKDVFEIKTDFQKSMTLINAEQPYECH